MIFQFNQQPRNPQKILDTAGRVARVAIQVLDASTLFIGSTRDTMSQTSGSAALQQGLQIIQTDRIVQFWWKGEIWAVNTTAGGVIDIEAWTLDGSPVRLEAGVSEEEAAGCMTC